MENEEGVKVDLYIPRKCSFTNRIIAANDNASIQFNVGHVDAQGHIIPGEYTTFALCGSVRKQGSSDHAINVLATKQGLLKNVLRKIMVL